MSEGGIERGSEGERKERKREKRRKIEREGRKEGSLFWKHSLEVWVN